MFGGPVMYAQPGDWLIVEGGANRGPTRRGLIEEVHSRDGSPPYLVHWSDTGHRALTFPGPDAYVLSSVQLREREQRAAARFAALRRELPHPAISAESTSEPGTTTQGTR
ncbi:DUF1918 domain-containing protein [Nocardia sp. NPDC049707]|uniref:DUF1918 domain-containing protein n=1 Tax=Nocardia sp. NPDC049707 TaxID=3154735 RepID=UPI003426E525